MNRTFLLVALATLVVLLPGLVTVLAHPGDLDARYSLGSGLRAVESTTDPTSVEHVPAHRTTTTEAPAPKRRTVRATSAAPVPGNIWDQLCECECHGNWSCNTGNGFSGGLQMDADFWLAYGGHEFAPEPWMASREQQIIVAERGRAARGFYPWPHCARKLGLIA